MMNKSAIDWCDFTWNPVTGCRHGCAYCYARTMARRFCGDTRINRNDPQMDRFLDKNGRAYYHLAQPFKTQRGAVCLVPAGFEPTFHEYRLPDPTRKKKPATIFVVSMGDLFAEEIPAAWIDKVFQACEAAPQHNYMFLTKNPRRYQRLSAAGILPQRSNFWYGTSVPTPDTHFFERAGYNTFISVEPISETFEGAGKAISQEVVRKLGWIIIGAETGNRKGKIYPERSWIEPIIEAAREAGVPVLMKDSAELRAAWGDDLVREFPPQLRPMKEDNSVPHCRGCLAAEKRRQGKRGDTFTCKSTGQHVPSRYTRSSPPWCPRRKE